jgi:hypothetical protein
MRPLVCLVLLACAFATATCGRGQAAAPTSTAAAIASASTTTPSPTAVPVIPRQHLTLAPDIPFPARLNVVIGWGGFHHGGPGLFALERYSANSAGTVRVADLLPAVAGDAGRLMGIVASPDTTWAAVCDRPDCGSEGPVATPVETTFRISKDGGATWSDAATRPGRWDLRGWTDGQAFAVNWDGPATQYALEPSGTPIAPPVPDAYSPLQFKDELLWTNATGELVRAGGSVYTPLFAPLPTGFIPQSLSHAGANIAAGGYLPPPPGVSAPTVTYLFVGRPGTPEPETYYTFGPAPLVPVMWMDATRLLVTAEFERTCHGSPNGSGSLAVIDLDAGTLAFIGAPLIVDGCGKGGPIVISAAQGDFGFVHTAGDCLNIRTAAALDAPVKTCLADGAMLTIIGASETVAGRAWLPVTMVNGDAGWAAAEFVAR